MKDLSLWLQGAGAVLALLAIYLLALLPRLRRPVRQLDRLRRFRYAHRGLHGKNVPENSLAAFRLAVRVGLGVELDVRLTRDRQLVVIHDSDLRRLCGVEGKVEKSTWEELQTLRLQGTEERIPLLDEVLPLLSERVPAIIEVKTDRGNARSLCRLLCKRLESYRGLFCLESFDPRVLRWLRRNEPFLVRGQLAQGARRHGKEDKTPLPVRWVGGTLLANFYGKPDFVAYRYQDRRHKLGLWICRRLYGLPEISWTVASQAELEEAEAADCTAIFEGFLPDRAALEKAAQRGTPFAAEQK